MSDLQLGDCVELIRAENLRAIDVLVAREIFGLDVLGRARVCYCDGCCFVAQPSEVEAENDFVYLRECACAEVERIEQEFIAEHPEIEPMEKVKILGHDGMCLEDVPEYTTSIAAAWAIVEKFRLIVHPYGVKWLATPYNSVSDWHMLLADTAPLAICLAAIQMNREKKVSND